MWRKKQIKGYKDREKMVFNCIHCKQPLTKDCYNRDELGLLHFRCFNEKCYKGDQLMVIFTDYPLNFIDQFNLVLVYCHRLEEFRFNWKVNQLKGHNADPLRVDSIELLEKNDKGERCIIAHTEDARFNRDSDRVYFDSSITAIEIPIIRLRSLYHIDAYFSYRKAWSNYESRQETLDKEITKLVKSEKSLVELKSVYAKTPNTHIKKLLEQEKAQIIESQKNIVSLEKDIADLQVTIQCWERLKKEEN